MGPGSAEPRASRDDELQTRADDEHAPDTAGPAAEVDRPAVDTSSSAQPPPVEPSAPLPDAIIPAHAILGDDGVRRLRRRYADLAARIAGRVADADQQVRLKEQADRLNPDTWGSEDEVRRALEQYEAVLESVRAVVGQPRRRRQRDDNAGNQGLESV